MNASVEQVRAILAELVKAALVSDDGRSLAYREAARDLLKDLAAAPPDPASVRMDGAWTLAVADAETPARQPEQGRVNLTLPRQAPFTLADLLAPDFDVDRAVDDIGKAASTG